MISNKENAISQFHDYSLISLLLICFIKKLLSAHRADSQCFTNAEYLVFKNPTFDRAEVATSVKPGRLCRLKSTGIRI